MRTTLDLEDNLLQRAKELATRTRRSLKSVVEDALRSALNRAEEQPKRQRVVLPVSECTGWLQPGVDINNSAALLDLMDKEYFERLRQDLKDTASDSAPTTTEENK